VFCHPYVLCVSKNFIEVSYTRPYKSFSSVQAIHIETSTSHQVMSLENVALLSQASGFVLSSNASVSRLVHVKDTVCTRLSLVFIFHLHNSVHLTLSPCAIASKCPEVARQHIQARTNSSLASLS
jgi:hypothetical protein